MRFILKPNKKIRRLLCNCTLAKVRNVVFQNVRLKIVIGLGDVVRMEKENKIIQKSHFKYGNKKIILIYCNYKNLVWYLGKLNGTNIIIINCNYNSIERRKLFHKIIKKVKPLK